MNIDEYNKERLVLSKRTLKTFLRMINEEGHTPMEAYKKLFPDCNFIGQALQVYKKQWNIQIKKVYSAKIKPTNNNNNKTK